MNSWLTWREATRRALYGSADAFYHRPEGPAGHFRTSVHASPLFARALATLASACGVDTVVDVGAGRGELLVALRRIAPGLHLFGVDVAARPEGLPPGIGWDTQVPQGAQALLVANEWLDNVPVDVVEVDRHGTLRLVEVDPGTGHERLGEPLPADGPEAAWLARWWPLSGAEPGLRAEVGAPRDDVWARAVARLGEGVAVAVDYGHTRSGRPRFGSLAGYRQGRQVPPVPDGTCDVTCHVAVDAVLAAGARSAPPGSAEPVLITQRTALHALGVRGTRPPFELARTDPRGYLTGLREAGEAGELTAVGGLGDFHWVVQPVGRTLPGVLAD